MAQRALATAFVNIVPGTKDLEGYLKSKLASEMGKAGNDAGENFTDEFGKKLKTDGSNEAKAAGKKAGEGYGNSFGNSVKGLLKGALAAAAVAGVGAFVGNAVNAAKALNVESLGVEQVFGDAAGIVQDFGKNAAATAGLTAAAALGAAKQFGVIATNAGLAGKEAATFSTSLVQAAGDLASFNGGTAEEALSAIQSAIQGQYEPLRQYSIFLDDAQLRQAAFAAGITNSTDQALTPQQKALATQAYLMENMGVAAGDFVNYADSFDNALQTMKAELENTSATIGMALLPALGEVVGAINPIIEQVGPLLADVFVQLVPLIEFLADAITQLSPIFEPLVEIMGILIGVGIQILEALLPPLIDIFIALMPVIVDVANLFGQLAEAVLPPLVKLLEQVLIPVLLWLFDNFQTYGVPILERIIDLFGTGLTWAVDAVTKGFNWLKENLGPVWEAIKPFIEGFMALIGVKPVKLTVKTDFKTTGTNPFAAGMGNPLATGKPNTKIDFSTAALSGATGGTGAGKSGGKNPRQVVKDAVKVANKGIKDATKAYNKSVKEANKVYNDAVAEAYTDYAKAQNDAIAKRDEALSDALKDHNKRVASIESDFAKKQADIIAESMNRLRNAYRDAVAVNVGELFTSEEVGGRVDKLVLDLTSRLKAAKDLVTNAGKLNAAGFSQTFIEQVVALGGEAGNEMALALLNAAPETRDQLQYLFGELEVQSETGMDGLSQAIYDKAGLATQALRDLYAQTQAELVTALAEEELIYAEATAAINAQFTEAMAKADQDLATAIFDAQTKLNQSLTKAKDQFTEKLENIQDVFTEKVKDMRGKTSGLTGEINTLISRIDTLQAKYSSVTGKSIVIPGAVPFAKGGYVDRPTYALIGEAGPEVVTPLADFERMVGLNGGKTLIYNAAPNQSLDSEMALIQAMRRAPVVAAW